MKILYLDLNLKYHNPTRNLIPSLLNLNNEVHIYGPGYVSDKVLEQGIEVYYQENGPFDFICSNEHISIFLPENYDNFEEYTENLHKQFYFLILY